MADDRDPMVALALAANAPPPEPPGVAGGRALGGAISPHIPFAGPGPGEAVGAAVGGAAGGANPLGFMLRTALGAALQGQPVAARAVGAAPEDAYASLGAAFHRLGTTLEALQTGATAAAGIQFAPQLHTEQQIAASLPPVVGGAAALAARPFLGVATAAQGGYLEPARAREMALRERGPQGFLETALAQQAAAPELHAGEKWLTEQAYHPLNWLPVMGRGTGLGPEMARGTLAAFNLPFRGAKAGYQALPFLPNRADSALAALADRFAHRVVDPIGVAYTEAGQMPRAQQVRAFLQAMELPTPAQRTATAAQATEEAATARAFGLADEATRVQTAQQATATAHAQAVPLVQGLDAATLKHFQALAEQDSRQLTKFIVPRLTGAPPPKGEPISLDALRRAVDPQDQADAWLDQTLAYIQQQGVQRGQVLGDVRVPGPRVSGLTGERLFAPETSGQLNRVILALQSPPRDALPPGDDVRHAIVLRWLQRERYGDWFPSPPADAPHDFAAAIAQLQTRARPAAPPLPGAALPEAPPPAVATEPLTVPWQQVPVPPLGEPPLVRLQARDVPAAIWDLPQTEQAAAIRALGVDVLDEAGQSTVLNPTLAARLRGGAPPPLEPLPTAAPEAPPTLPTPGVVLPEPGRPLPGPTVGLPAAPPGTLATLPPELAAAVPGYRSGTRVYEVAFANDVDRALYAVGSLSRGSAQAKPFLAWLDQVYPGEDPGALRQRGLQLRAGLPELARVAPAGETRLTVPALAGETAVPAAGPLGAVGDELTAARDALRIARQEEAGPDELIAAAQRVKLAEQTATATAAPPPPVPGADLTAEQWALNDRVRQIIGTSIGPEDEADLADLTRRLTTAEGAFQRDFQLAHTLREQLGLAESATLDDLAKAVGQQADSSLVKTVTDIRGRWGNTLLHTDADVPIMQDALRQYIKARDLNLGSYEIPVLKLLGGAWRIQALLSPGFHEINTIGSVVNNFLFTGHPGFTQGAKPWYPRDVFAGVRLGLPVNPEERAGLLRRAFEETRRDPRATDSPGMVLWKGTHPDLPDPAAELAATSHLPRSVDEVLTQIGKTDPEFSALRRMQEQLRAQGVETAPMALPEAVTGRGLSSEARSVLERVPWVGKLFTFNLNIGHALERSARSAAFVETFGEQMLAGKSQREAYLAGIAKAKELFFDYEDITNMDQVLRNVMAFHIFSTRTYNLYLPFLASNPLFFRGLRAYEDATGEEAEAHGMEHAARFAGGVRLPTQTGAAAQIVRLLFGQDGQIWVNPMRYLAIGEQLMSEPQHYRDETGVGAALNVLRQRGLGPGPWVDIPLGMTGLYGTRPPQAVTSVDPLLRGTAELVSGQPVELPWQTAQALRFPGQRQPNAPDVLVRHRLAEMSLERRPDFAQLSPDQSIAPEYALAMAQGPANALYREATRQLARERLVQTAFSKSGLPVQYQSIPDAAINWATGGLDPALTGPARVAALAQRAAALPPEARPLLGARGMPALKGYGERGAAPMGAPSESKAAWAVREYERGTPARRWALLNSGDLEIMVAIQQARARGTSLSYPRGR